MKAKANRTMTDALGIQTPETPEPITEVIEIQPKHPRASTREGKKMASVFFDKQVHDQLSILKIETGLSIQQLLIKALNLLFQSFNKPPIAE